jgi:D-xylose transport system permease protein
MTAPTDVTPARPQASLGSELASRFRMNIQTYTLILALVAIWAFFAFMTEGAYTNAQNISNLFRQMTVTAFLAIGMVLVIVTGNIDLSVGKAAGFVSVVVAYCQANLWAQLLPDQGVLSAILSALIGVGVGAAFGALQGYLVAFMNIPSFIVTLGGMFIMNGGILLVTQGRTIPANQPEFAVIAQGYLPPLVGWIVAGLVIAFLFLNMFRARQRRQKYGIAASNTTMDLLTTSFYSLAVVVYVVVVNTYNGIQIPVLLLAIVAMLIAYISNNTRFGRYSYAIGGNREAARLSGINIRQTIFMIFVLMGVLMGISGTVLASYVGYGTTAAGQGYELDAIASAILGGTSTLGGVGTVFGALMGALIMASLSNGLQMMNVQPAWQYLLKGLVLVVAVYADVYFKKNRG